MTKKKKIDHHDEVRKKVSETYKDWNKLKKSSKFVIPEKLSGLSQVNKTLSIILKLSITANIMIFLTLFIDYITWL